MSHEGRDRAEVSVLRHTHHIPSHLIPHRPSLSLFDRIASNPSPVMIRVNQSIKHQRWRWRRLEEFCSQTEGARESRPSKMRSPRDGDIKSRVGDIKSRVLPGAQHSPEHCSRMYMYCTLRYLKMLVLYLHSLSLADERGLLAHVLEQRRRETRLQASNCWLARLLHNPHRKPSMREAREGIRRAERTPADSHANYSRQMKAINVRKGRESLRKQEKKHSLLSYTSRHESRSKFHVK